MTTNKTYSLSSEDSTRLIEHSINLLESFKDGGVEDEAGEKAYNRVVVNKLNFNRDDVFMLAQWLNTLAGRARAKYQSEPMKDAPWQSAILQNADFAVETADNLLAMLRTADEDSVMNPHVQ